MSIFGSALADARKKAGLTQEQLANKINITRQALSHWENGRTLPDEETIARLSALLETDLTAAMLAQAEELRTKPQQMEQKTEAEAQISADPETTDADEKSVVTESAGRPEQKARQNWWKYLLCYAAGILTALAFTLPMINRPVPPPIPETTEAPEMTRAADEAADRKLDWYRALAAAEPANGTAHVVLAAKEDPVMPVPEPEGGDVMCWFYDFTIRETAGIDFHMKELTIFETNNDVEYNAGVYGAEQLAGFFGSATISANSEVSFSGGMPVQGLDGVAIMLTGEDANGNQLTFYGCVELRQ